MPRIVKRSRARVLKRGLREAVRSGHRDVLVIQGHLFYPSSMTLVKRYMSHARRTGMIRDPEEYGVGMQALVSAAMAEADEAGAKFVTPKHVAQGWAQRLSVGGGNHPPHRCLRSSVINRVDELRDSLPYFVDLSPIIK